MNRHWSRKIIQAMSRRKTLAEAMNSDNDGGPVLRRTLTAIDLILYGVGSSVGAGIYVMIGLGANIAGPAISLSFLGCGLACILTSLAYAEFASRIPVAGSAYIYTYIAFGEFAAWVIGWNLMLGYGFTTSVVARAWADYLGDLMVDVTRSWERFPTDLLELVVEWPIFGEHVDYSCSLLSMVIIALNSWILLRGANESARFNNLMTVTNISVLMLVVCAGIFSGSVKLDNLTPFVPHHTASVIQGAGLVFYAFIGFDMVASLSEEVIRPEVNMPIGIVGSLALSTLIYVSVSLAVVGMAPIKLLGKTVPIINALVANSICTHEDQLMDDANSVCLQHDDSMVKPFLFVIARIVSTGAVFGLMASTFTSMMGFPRILYRMSLDGLWFSSFAKIDPETHAPYMGITITGVFTALLACFVPLDALANLISLGTLMVFTFVDAGVILLRLQNVPVGAGDPTSVKDISQQRNRKISILLVFFSLALVGASIIASNFNSRLLVAGLLGASAILATAITLTPESWDTKKAATMHDNIASFECPFVPAIPLGGIACNSFMMGSLPLQAWLFCLVWLAIGVTFYFFYGLHHSTLGKTRSKPSFLDDTSPLISDAGGRNPGGYESTLNVSIHTLKHAESS